MQKIKTSSKNICKFWMVPVDTISIDDHSKEQFGYISEFKFCKYYNVSIDMFTRWIMKTPLRVHAGFSNIRYNEQQLIENMKCIMATR
jgi:hypothetical protein